MGRSFVRPEDSFDRTRSQSGRTKMQISMKKLNWFQRERSIDSFGLRRFNFVNWSSDDINLNKFKNWRIHASAAAFFVFSFLTKMYIAALVFEFYNFILTNKIHCTYHEMQAANETNKNERGIGGGLNLASLNCAFLPQACKYELQVIFILRQHYCIILVASLKKVCCCILGRVVTIRLIIKKDKTLVAKKELQ